MGCCCTAALVGQLLAGQHPLLLVVVVMWMVMTLSPLACPCWHMSWQGWWGS
jgi:hypothetical protein